MKKKLLSFFLLAAATAGGQTLTHHYDPYVQDIVPAGILSCADGGSPFDSSYFTTFNLSNAGYGIEGDQYHVSHVEFGVQEISGAASYPITIRLYSTEQNFPDGFATLNGYTLEAESTHEVPAQELAIYSAEISATIATDKILVVEISYEEDPTGGDIIMLLGGNPEGSWGSTWTVSPTCGVNTPTTLATIAAQNGLEGNFALVLNVIGNGNMGLDGLEAKSVNLYPNPTTGLVTVQGNSAIEKVTVADATGKVVALPTLQDNMIDMSSLSNGIYYFTIESESGTSTRKVIKH